MSMTEFEASARDHYRHHHCAGCGGCILDPRRFVVESHPVWCVGCVNRLKKLTPAGAPLPWDKGWDIANASAPLERTAKP